MSGKNATLTKFDEFLVPSVLQNWLFCSFRETAPDKCGLPVVDSAPRAETGSSPHQHRSNFIQVRAVVQRAKSAICKTSKSCAPMAKPPVILVRFARLVVHQPTRLGYHSPQWNARKIALRSRSISGNSTLSSSDPAHLQRNSPRQLDRKTSVINGNRVLTRSLRKADLSICP